MKDFNGPLLQSLLFSLVFVLAAADIEAPSSLAASSKESPISSINLHAS
jgi:hypothetical protein